MARERERNPGAEGRSPFAQRHRGIRGTGGRGLGRARLGRGERLGRGAQRRAPPSRPRSLPGRSRVIRCRRLRQAPLGWTLQAAAGGAAGKGLPSRGDARRSPRRFSHARSPSLRACAPPRGGRAEPSPSGRRARSPYLRPGEDAQSERSWAPASPTPPPAAPLPTRGDGAGRTQGRGM